MILADCQSTDDLIAMLTQTNGPTQQVAINQARERPHGRHPIMPPNQTETGMTVGVRCRTPDGQDGECVLHHLCNPQSNGNRAINFYDTNGVCLSYLDICCRPSDINLNQPMKPLQQQRIGCGWANPEGVGINTVGSSNENTKFGEFPWMVAILKVMHINIDEPSDNRQFLYIGGGSLIHPSVVLTVAHYVASAKTIKIRAGEWDTQTTKEIFPFQDRDVVSIEIHENFDERQLAYDIAVVFLGEPMDLAPNVGVVCLPPAGIAQKENTRCIATGWGKDKFGKEGRYQVLLKKIELPVVRHDDCQAALRKTRLGKYFQLHHTFMCAGGEPGKDTCTGDGGAPLSCPIEYEKDRYVQSGVVAWGIGCGKDGSPGVYVDVSVVKDWIDNTVAGKGYDPMTYSY